MINKTTNKMNIMSTKLDLLKLDVSQIELTQFEELKKAQFELVEQNPFIDIVDAKTYDEGKKRRTALRTGRTTVQNQDKEIASRIALVRKFVKGKNDELIEIVSQAESKQQEEVSRWENAIEEKRKEKERLEKERVDKIDLMIQTFESDCYELIQKMQFSTIQETKVILDKKFNSEMEVEEYDYLLTLAKNRVQSSFDIKCSELEVKENERLENERLRKEKEESDAKLKAIQEQQDKERLEREQKELEQKDKVFEIRKNRILELYPNIDFDIPTFIFYGYTLKNIYNADVIDFENILTDAKRQIQEAKDKLEKQKAENEAIEKANLEAKKKAEKENKARIKRLANDKKIISESLEVYFADLHLETENKETIQFIENANVKIQSLKNELLIELNNL